MIKYYKIQVSLLLIFATLISCEKNNSVRITDNNQGVEKLNELVGDYQHIIFYGQSLGMGWEAAEAITTQSMEGNLMLGTNPNFKYANENNLFKALTATKWQSGGEQPIVAAVNAFSYKYRTEVRKGIKFIGTTGGEGGQSIELLSKEYPAPNSLYNSTFLRPLNNAKTIVDSEKSTIACPAIIYMQGEFNYDGLNGGLGFGGNDAVITKDEYKALLLKLKNNMQDDIVRIYGQKEKPKFFIYQTSGNYIRNRELSINMAQFEFAQEHEDVILLNPAYFASDYGAGHLSTNGYRWYGESIAKSLYKELLKGDDSEPVYPIDYNVNGNSISIQFHVPNLPLVFDTWTNQAVQSNGFTVYKDGNEVRITKLEIVEDKVNLTLAESLTGKIELSYSGQSRNGNGNLRDSEYYSSYYSYYDDSKNSYKESYTPSRSRTSIEKIYGLSYPLQNWCVPFYYTVNK